MTLTFDLESGVRVNFSLPRPLCSRLRPDVRNRRTCTCRCRADEADALNAPIFTFVQPILERNDRFSFIDVAWQFVPYTHHTLTVEEFPGVETTSRLIQLELVSTKVMVILAQHRKLSLSMFSFRVSILYVSMRSPLILRFSNVVKPMRRNRSS